MAICHYCKRRIGVQVFPFRCKCGALLTTLLTGKETPEELAELERKAWGGEPPLLFWLAA